MEKVDELTPLVWPPRSSRSLSGKMIVGDFFVVVAVGQDQTCDPGVTGAVMR